MTRRAHALLMPTLYFTLMALLFGGCATLFQSSEQKVLINSEPPGAEVRLNGIAAGHTPVEVVVHPTTTYRLSLHKQGYLPFEMELRPSFAWEHVGPIAYNAVNHQPVSVTLRRP